ncbi:MAG: EAL domain-containing protein [Candidatus Methylumidiphilus sp.]
MDQTPHTRRFLSLKWKALLFTSLVLIAVTATFATFNYLEFRDLFHQRRENLQEQYALQVQGLLDQSSNRLQQLSAAVASLLNKQTDTAKKSKKSLIAAVETLVPILEVDMGVESIALVSATGERLAANQMYIDSGGPESVAEAVRQVVKTESPVSLIDCSASCLHFTVAPVLGEKGSVGAIVLGVSLADLVLDFKRVSGTDLGLIVEQDAAIPLKTDAERWLSGWRASVVALSNVEKNMQVLRGLAGKVPNLQRLSDPVYTEFQGQELEARSFPLRGFGKRQIAYLVVIADIGEAISRIRSTTKRSILLGSIGLLLSELLLLAILWPPMSRLKRAAAILPRLAEGTFSAARTEISDMRPTHVFRDEVDALNDTAIALSHQLEALNDEVAKRTQDLSERMEDITRERNFVTNVLDTAHAIILTQNHRQEILMVNPYGLALLGYDLAELRGMRFQALLKQHAPGVDVSAYLSELAAGRREHFELESDLHCKDNGILNVVWQHSRLQDHSVDGAVILSVGMDITARKKAELRLAWLTDHDPLTGLFNRRRFEKELEDAIASAKRYRHTGALLFFDLDQFKYVNDTSGHGAGDRLLVILSNSLPTLLREVDIIGRLGGDEFGVILGHANADEAVQVARKILAHISGTEFSVGDRVHKVSASIGVALFPEHGSEVQDLLARTDLAMYQVKESGRGGWYLLSTDDKSHRQMQERVLWKQRVENALAEKRFVLFAQPIVHIRTGVTSHWEVLLRMRGEGDSLIGPAHFIEIAESTGLIHSLDRMVLSEAAAHLALMRGRGREITLTVNLSAHAFNDPDLLIHLKKVIADNRLNPRQIIFEMTETAAVADIGPARRLMEAINETGCQFALDDFGTGFSSFDYLRQLPFEYIKIDGSFIRNLSSRPDDQVLVKAMVDIAVAFKKKTIAEQVEDAKTLALLKEYGVDYSQGYYTGRPVEINQATL